MAHGNKTEGSDGSVRERGRRDADTPDRRLEAFLARVRPSLDTMPVGPEEWDAACDDPLLAPSTPVKPPAGSRRPG